MIPEPLHLDLPVSRRPRRDRLYSPTHWRARLASWLRSLAERVNPLVSP